MSISKKLSLENIQHSIKQLLNTAKPLQQTKIVEEKII